MYLTLLKSAMVEAIRSVFQSDYPEPDFTSVTASIEYPVDRSQYPSIWVTYVDTAPVHQAGIGQVEQVTFNVAGQPPVAEYTRFEYEGTVSFTVVALSSLERDRLYDQLIRVITVGDENTATARFRQHIETNDFIAINGRFDSVEVTGESAVPGTPWGTDEVIYERTVNFDVQGSYFILPTVGTLVNLSAIEVTPAPTVDFTLQGPNSGSVPTWF